MKYLFSIFITALLAIPAIGQQQDRTPVYIGAAEAIAGETGVFRRDRIGGRLEQRGIEFAEAINNAITKKQVPVSIVTDEGEALWKIESVVEEINDGAANITKKLFGEKVTEPGFLYTIKVSDIETGAVVFDFNVKKPNGPYGDGFKSAAEDFAERFKKQLAKTND